MANSNTTQHNGWGGSWTEQKLDCFESYVKAYLTIMNVYRDKFNWRLIYFDGFAGSGSRSEKEKTKEQDYACEVFGPEFLDGRELDVYQGAAERVVRLEETMRGFDFYYFIDKFEENLTRLELKLANYPTKGLRQFRVGDANEQALQLGNALKKDSRLKCLCLLDPFGMTLDWKTIEALSGKSIDLWILLPSGVIVNRLLKKNGELMHLDRLQSFFGMGEDELRAWFYEQKQEMNLFGQQTEWFQKKDNPIQLIAELYIERLGELFPYVTPEPLVMRNKNNVPIYHFVCASFNQTAVKIAQQIITKRQK